MTKRIILAIVAVFIAWAVMDYILHGVILQSTYEATAQMWRPMDQMHIPLMYFVTLVFTVCFVLIYGFLVGRKSVASGLKFGVLFGLATGFSMGFGSYSYLPIPLSLALAWFFGVWIEAVIGGAIVGAIIKS